MKDDVYAKIDVPLIRKEFLPKAIAEEILAEDKRPIESNLRHLAIILF